MKVRATRDGFYPTLTPIGEDWKRRREGDVFTLFERTITVIDIHSQKPARNEDGSPKVLVLSPEQQFSERWMEREDEDTPEHTTAGHEKLKAVNDELIAEKRMSVAASKRK
jgi:hypothetical protein